MLDDDQVTEYQRRIIDRYTAPELAELLDLSPEDMCDRFFEELLRCPEIMEEVGLLEAD